MSIEGELNRIQGQINSAFSVIQARGGTVNSRKVEKLSAAIQSIPTGSTSTDLSSVLNFQLGKDWLVSESVQFGTNNLRWITRGPDRFVGVGNKGVLIHSEDGLTWTVASMPNDSGSASSWIYVTYANDRYIATNSTRYGSTKMFAYSFDGINWNTGGSTITGTCNVTSIVYGNDIYVGVDAYDWSAIVSDDGISWRRIQNDDLDGVMDVTYVNGKFFFTTGSRKVFVTSDLETVTVITPDPDIPNQLTHVESYGNTIVFIRLDHVVMSQDAGETWNTTELSTTIGSKTDPDVRPFYANGLWIFVGTTIASTDDPGLFIYTKDFVNWGKTHYPNSHRNDFCGAAYDGDKLIVAMYSMSTPLISIGPVPSDV